MPISPGVVLEEMLEPVDVVVAVLHVGVAHQRAEQRQRGVDAIHDEFVERAAQAHQRLGPGAAVHDELADQRIIVGRDRVAGVDGRIDADAETAGRMIIGDLAGRRPEGRGVFGVDAALDGVAAQHHVVLLDRERGAPGDLDLLVDEVESGQHLRDGMLDLDARVHLDEVELAILVEEFDRAGAGIAHVAHGLGADAADAGALALVQRRGRAFLPDLLVASLQRAVAFAQVDGMALPVAEDLDLDVPRLLQVFFQIDRVVAEGGLGLGPRAWTARWRGSSAVSASFMPRPPPPDAALTSTGKPILAATARPSSSVVMAPSEPGTQGMPRLIAVFLASILSPMMRMCSAFGPMKPML